MGALQIYRASAGAGKTYQLALKYITLLLGKFKSGRLHLFKGNDLRRHREILAITFTNKATQEMRRRIVSELSLLADINSASDYRRDIHLMIDPDDVCLLNADVDREISLAATRALDSMLFDFGEMQISTIDAFFQRVLRSFAYEADLAGNYELMLENDRMTDMAISDMLAHACGMKGVVVPKNLNSGYLRLQVKRLIEYQAGKGGEYKVFSPDSNLRADMVRYIGQLSDENYLEHKADIDFFLQKPNAITDFVSAIERKRPELIAELAVLVDGIISCAAADKLSSYARNFLATASAGNIESLSPTYLSRLLITEDYNGFLKKNKYDDAVISDFTGRMRAFGGKLREIITFDVMTANVRFLGLFRETLVMRQELKAHLNTILLSDTNELLNLIIDGCETPFIYERIGRQLRHFLIDEFQDTSKMQWRNLLPLLSESLSTQNDNLIIGDVKQCIYRFRNSNPELLARDIDRTPQINSYIEHCTLDDNWRSAPTIINFNNELFEAAGKCSGVKPPKADAYNDVRQIARRTVYAGYVDAALVDDGDEAAAYDRMLDHISRQLQSGYTPGDIVVLVRSNNNARDCVNVLLGAVREGKLPHNTMVVSDEALCVSSADSVKWIVNRLHEMNAIPGKNSGFNSRGLRRAMPEDIDRLQEKILAEKSTGAGDEVLEKVIADFNARRAENADDAAMRLAHSRGQSLTEVVEQLIRELPDKELTKTEVQYLCAFQDLVLDYCRQKNPTLQGFLKLWDEKLADKAAVGLAEGVNAIRVMTIHKSKGLEFRCVHIPLINRYLDKDNRTRWYDVKDFLEGQQLGVNIPRYFPLPPGSTGKGTSLSYTVLADKFKELKDDQTIDEINALYVAFTRARQELIVTFFTPRGMKKEAVSDNKLPINHPSGLFCPIIAKMAGNNDLRWSFGSPTTKYTSAGNSDKDNEILLQPITDYTTRRRPEMWSQTRAATTSDSGEIT